MTTGLRRDQIRGFELRAGEIGTDELLDGSVTEPKLAANAVTTGKIADGTILVGDFNANVYGSTPTSIDPDDAQAGGSATTLSRNDHQHAITAGTPVDVATANSEGSSGSFARADHVHANLAYGAFVSLTSAEATATGVTEVIAWDQADEWNGLDFWAVGNPTRLLCPLGIGLYQVTLNLDWEPNTTERRRAIIRHSAQGIVGSAIWDAVSTESTVQSVTSRVVRCSVTDYFECEGTQFSGGALNLETAETFASIHFLGYAP